MDENHLVEDHLVAVKTDGSIELYSISKTSEDFSSSCDAVVGKEQLKGLLHDRGKGSKNLYIILLNRSMCLLLTCQLATDEVTRLLSQSIYLKVKFNEIWTNFLVN